MWHNCGWLYIHLIVVSHSIRLVLDAIAFFISVASISIGTRRLVRNGTSQNSGRLEFYNEYWNYSLGIAGYDWLPICIIWFDISDADQFCRHLGYLHSASYDTVKNLG